MGLPPITGTESGRAPALDRPKLSSLPPWAAGARIIFAVLGTASSPAVANDTPTALLPLGFGSVAAIGTGSVTVYPFGGRTAQGAVFLVNPDHGTPAQVLVRSRRPHAAFSVALPEHFLVADPGGGHALKVSALMTEPSGLRFTGPGSSQTVGIGATLHFKGIAAPGAYQGSFAVAVAYP